MRPRIRSQAQALASRLQGEIEGGSHRPGDQLPSYRELADEYGVGLTTVRDAIRLLAQHGRVETRQGAGTFVRGPAPSVRSSDPEGQIARHLIADEARALIDMHYAPVYTLLGAVFVSLRATLEGSSYVDAWRVTSRKAVIEWGDGPSVEEATNAVLPRALADISYLSGVPGLRLMTQTEAEATFGWHGAEGTELLFRRIAMKSDYD